MDAVFSNGSTIVLDDGLNEYERFQASESFVIYAQFLSQLHFPHEKWQYEANRSGHILVERPPELLMLDTVLFKELDYTKLVKPLQLYTYYLLQAFLGNNLVFNGLGLLPERKTRIIYLQMELDLEEMNKKTFKTNDLSRFMLKKASKEDLLHTHETFFVLLDEKFKSKLWNALTLFHAETGKPVEKSRWVDHVLSNDRLAQLKAFSKQLIEQK